MHHIVDGLIRYCCLDYELDVYLVINNGICVIRGQEDLQEVKRDGVSGRIILSVQHSSVRKVRHDGLVRDGIIPHPDIAVPISMRVTAADCLVLGVFHIVACEVRSIVGTIGWKHCVRGTVSVLSEIIAQIA